MCHQGMHDDNFSVKKVLGKHLINFLFEMV